MGNIERTTTGHCQVCGHYTPMIRRDFVPERLLNKERATNEHLREQLRGAVEALDDLRAILDDPEMRDDETRVHQALARLTSAPSATWGQ